MAILLNRSTRVIVQGFTGKIGSFHAEDMAPASIARARQHDTCQAIFAIILAISAVSNALSV